MRCWLLVLLATASMVGCQSNRAWMPFAPYGQQTIPPPPTGSLGYNNYYNQTQTAALPSPNLPASPTLRSEPSLPAEPTTLAAPNTTPGENWETAEKPTLDTGASSAPVIPKRALPRNLRPSDKLAWVPPFRASEGFPVIGNQSIPQQAPYLAPATIPTYIQPVSAQAPLYGSPLRPSVVRSAATYDPSCNCDPLSPSFDGQPIPQASVANVVGGEVTRSGNLQWGQSARR